MIQAYEMMYILRPNLLEEQISESVNKYRDLLTENGATNIHIKLWGKRRLAYPIDKHQEGTYILMNYLATGQQVAVVERAMRLSEEVIRYLTMKLEKEPAPSEDSFKGLIQPAVARQEQPEQVTPETVAVQEEQPEQVAPETVAVQEEQPEQVPTETVAVQEEQPEQVAPETVAVQEEQPDRVPTETVEA